MHEVGLWRRYSYTVVCQQLVTGACTSLELLLEITVHMHLYEEERVEEEKEVQARIKFYVQQFKMCLMAFPLVSLLFQEVEYMTSHSHSF